MTITKKIRFEIFKRDGFKCAYCGKEPPGIVLEVDHIEAKSNGGTDDFENLITSCFDCNRGKRNIPLSKIPLQISENIKLLQKKEEQLKEYKKFLKKIEKRINIDIEKISKIYEDQYQNWTLTDSFKTSIKHFLKFLTVNEIIESLLISINKFPNNKDDVIKYFCGICWNKIKTKENPNYISKNHLIKYWREQPRGSGYLHNGLLLKWMKKYDPVFIKEKMDIAQGIWQSLKNELED